MMMRSRAWFYVTALTLSFGLAGCARTPSSTSSASSASSSAKTHARRRNAFRVHGTIRALGTNTLTLVTKAGVTHTFDLTGTTKFLEKKSPVARTQLKTGEVVTVVPARQALTPTAHVVRIFPRST